jgi:hypothetical protein
LPLGSAETNNMRCHKINNWITRDND